MAIVDELTLLKNTKQEIKTALEAKGQNPTDVFSSYAQNITDMPYQIVTKQEVTQEEYDALGDVVNSNNILYVIV